MTRDGLRIASRIAAGPAAALATAFPMLRVLVLVLAGYCVGHGGATLVLGAVLLVIGSLVVGTRTWRYILLALFVASLGWLRWQVAWSSPLRAIESWTPVVVKGLVVERLQLEGRVQLRLRGRVAPTDSDAAAVRGTVLARCPDELDPSIRYGTMVRCSGVLVQPSAERNPGGFDYASYLAQRRAHASLLVAEPSDVAAMGVGGWRIKRSLDRFRHRLFALFDRILEPPYNALFAGILLGERRSIPRPILQDFVEGGVIHVLVISGANFALLAGTVFLLARLARLPLPAVYGTTVAVACLFALLVGFQPPVARAGLMIGLVLLNRQLGRGVGRFQLVALSALILLAWHPVSMLHAGFQLSFGATIGILYFVPRWHR